MEQINSTPIHPLDVLTQFIAELEDDRQLTYDQKKLRLQAIRWLIARCEDVSAALALVRNADLDIEHSTDLAVRLKAQADKKRIYDVIDSSESIHDRNAP